jgi:hypothetical protein
MACGSISSIREYVLTANKNSVGNAPNGVKMVNVSPVVSFPIVIVTIAELGLPKSSGDNTGLRIALGVVLKLRRRTSKKTLYGKNLKKLLHEELSLISL